MKLDEVRFNIDSGISIFCEKSHEGELNRLRHAIVNYDISLIKNPLNHISERYKVDKESIQVQDNHFILFFPLDNIINTVESQISFKSIIFSTEGNKKIPYTINKTFSFRELQKNGSSKIFNATTLKKKPRYIQRESTEKRTLSSKERSFHET